MIIARTIVDARANNTLKIVQLNVKQWVMDFGALC
jgi:hypothetical protein